MLSKVRIGETYVIRQAHLTTSKHLYFHLFVPEYHSLVSIYVLEMKKASDPADTLCCAKVNDNVHYTLVKFMLYELIVERNPVCFYLL